MLTLLSRLQAGTLGELLTVAKLNSLGHAAYISPEGAPGHDVIIVIAGLAKSVEVKTRQFRTSPARDITRWPVNMTTKGDADFFIFIELELKTLTSTFYMLTTRTTSRPSQQTTPANLCLPTSTELSERRHRDLQLTLKIMRRMPVVRSQGLSRHIQGRSKKCQCIRFTIINF